MNPEIEVTLEQSLASLKPTLPGVAAVEIEPDYDADFGGNTVAEIYGELVILLSTEGLTSPVDVHSFPTLARTLRQVLLHPGPSPEEPWIEVTPPGNWI